VHVSEHCLFKTQDDRSYFARSSVHVRNQVCADACACDRSIVAALSLPSPGRTIDVTVRLLCYLDAVKTPWNHLRSLGPGGAVFESREGPRLTTSNVFFGGAHARECAVFKSRLGPQTIGRLRSITLSVGSVWHACPDSMV
jgi:hypothetical protein